MSFRPYDGSNADYADDDNAMPVREDFGGGGGGAAARRGAPRVATGVASLSLGTSATARPNSGTQIVRWISEDDEAAPLVVHVDVRGPATPGASNPFASQTLMLANGDGVHDISTVYGVLRVTYGAGNAVRVVDMDLRSGSYQLPPSTVCTVEAFMYGTGSGTQFKYTVSASVVVGRTFNPARPFNTVRITSLAAAASLSTSVPWQARWLGVAGGGPTAIGAGQPVLLVSPARGPAILQDWVNGVFVNGPGSMVELFDRGTVTIKNNGANAVSAYLRFGLEL